MPPKQAKDFAISEDETFKLQGADASMAKKTAKDDSVILNIDDEDIVLSKNGRKFLGQSSALTLDSSGFFLFDVFKKLNRYFVLHSNLKDQEKADFFHLLGVMINSGVPVIRSLKSLLNQVKVDSHLYLVIKDVLEKVESGQSLSEALAYHPDEFSEMEIGMIEAGEAAGQLNKALHNLATYIASKNEIKHKIKSAMMYPIVIVVLLFLVMTAMMVFVIPKMKELFDRASEQLPLITRIVIGISDFMNNYGGYLAAGILVFILLLMMWRKTDTGRYVWDSMKIRMPIFGKLFVKTYISRFARSLSNLLGSGVPIVKGLEITASAIGNDVYKRRIFLAGEDVKQGIPLAENLSDPKLFPVMLANMVEVGEKTAQMDVILDKIANFYEEEVSTTVAGIAKIIEPIVLVLIGLSVGAIAAAIMLPIMQLSNMAGSF